MSRLGYSQVALPNAHNPQEVGGSWGEPPSPSANLRDAEPANATEVAPYPSKDSNLDQMVQGHPSYQLDDRGAIELAR